MHRVSGITVVRCNTTKLARLRRAYVIPQTEIVDHPVVTDGCHFDTGLRPVCVVKSARYAATPTQGCDRPAINRLLASQGAFHGRACARYRLRQSSFAERRHSYDVV